MLRRQAQLLAAAAISFGGPLSAQTGFPPVAAVSRYTGLSAPTHVTHAGDGSGRLFIVQQGGRIRLVSGGALVTTPFLDIAERVSCCGERGLLSVAFPPGYASRRRHFYVDYTNRNGDTTISRFGLTANPDVADAASEEILLVIAQPYANHNGGPLVFGPDGFLYIGMGDGGSGGDPMNNAQSPGSLLGKLLRIDVESAVAPYAVPPSNPFVGRAGYRPEIWALGLRNPWRFSFDRATSDLYIGDVGQNAYEEIDFAPAGGAGGENYGWRLTEGLHCFNPPSCDQSGLTPPVAEYGHDLGCSVTGGFVYRGGTYARLGGIYFYGDYCSGRIWGLRRVFGSWEDAELVKTGLGITTFGEDEAGEIYVADGSAVYQLVDPSGPSAARLVPVVVDTSGANGARYSSDLSLTNRGTTAATASLTYTAAPGFGASESGTVMETLPAGRQLVIPDALAYLRRKGLAIPAGGSQGGSLRVLFTGLSAPGVASVTARTTTPSGAGRAGVAYAGTEGPAAGRVVLFGLRQSAADRTNLALVNAGASGPVTLRVTLVSGDAGDGRTRTLPDVVLAPGEWTQLDSVLEGAGLSNASAFVERVSGTDPFVAYVVVNDNRTGDGSFVPALPAARAAPSQLLPVLVETPSFESELVLASSSGVPQTVTLEYVESLASSAVSTGKIVETLAPREQRIVPGALAYLRARGASIGPRGGAYAGALLVTFSPPEGGFAGARTSAPAPGGGSYGLFYAALSAAEQASSEAFVDGLRQDETVRTNLALVAGPAPVALHYDVFDGGTGSIVRSGDVSLRRGGWTQINAILAGTPAATGYVRIRKTSGDGTFAAYAVLNDGASPGKGTGDGSYLGMAP